MTAKKNSKNNNIVDCDIPLRGLRFPLLATSLINSTSSKAFKFEKTIQTFRLNS